MEAGAAKETALKGEKKDYSFLDLIQNPAFVVDVDKKVLYANEGFLDLVAKKREQAIGHLIASLIKAEESGVDAALATGERATIVSWCIIRDKKYFLEFKPTPLLDEQGCVTSVLETIRDLTGQTLALKAVQDLLVKVKTGDLSTRADADKHKGNYKLLIENFNEMLDTIAEPIGDGKRQLHRQVFAGTSLPANVEQEPSTLGEPFDCNVLHQQP